MPLSDFWDTLSTIAQPFLPQQQVDPSQSVLAQIAQQPPAQTPQAPQQVQQQAPQQAPQDFGSALARIAAATNGPDSLQKYDIGQQTLQQNAALGGAAGGLVNSNDPNLSALAKLAVAAPSAAGPILGDYLKSKGVATAQFGALTGGAGIGGMNPNGSTGDDFLKTVPQPLQPMVKAIAEGRAPYPSGFALKSPMGQYLATAVGQYDPQFDTANPTARAATRKDFTSGKSADNITALNTAMAHASSLKDAYDKLGNGDYHWLNNIENKVGAATGDQDTQSGVADVSAKGHALSGELAKVFRSTGMAESDIQSWEDKLDSSATPAQQKATLNAAMDLMNGRLQALTERYNQGMGTTKQPLELLSPKAQQAYKKVTGEEAPQTTNAVSNTSSIPDLSKLTDDQLRVLAKKK